MAHRLKEAVLLSACCFSLLAHARTPDPISGEQVFHAAGGCGCHTDTDQDGALLAGGRPIPTPFGLFYSTNITPDPQTGIGGWSDEDFLRAMTEGVGPDGTHYFPVFPYTSFSQMTREDLLYLKDYLDTLPAVNQPDRPHEVPFPFNLRVGAWFWKLVNHHPRPLEPDPTQTASWNRGRYLTEAVAHCGECHTPRNLMGALRTDLAYAGAEEGPEGESAPNITPDPETGIGDWSKADLVYALEVGMLPDGDFVGGLMGLAVNHYQQLPPEDLDAIAEYLQSLPPIVNQVGPRKEATDSAW